ncbi:syntenin-1-like [Mytilus californianus]|uniref:syntenin-1-like n=1 Tax=Mytilus californianus TaxID=6549 RepID=UPI002247C39D|nr:syntenin-1-like [Mytilus californianus]XP_052088566.1 syntenin-1-like [Mytilus californianus]XP_052088570.1 syntenin-1-like [Mytilus californianus]
MSRLYPTLEDMKVDQMQQAQHQYESAASQPITYPQQGAPASYPQQGTAAPYPQQSGSSLYPSLGEYMGLNLTPQFVEQNMPVVAHNMQIATTPSPSQSMIAPITGQGNKGLVRAEIKGGVKELVACKDSEGKIGLRLRHINSGLFVALVQNNLPAALAGLRFGDQILQINGQNVAGWNTDKAHEFLKKANPDRITFAIRDRPFERTITMQKDSAGYIGFVFKDGKIKSIVKDSSAARNGVLTDHHLIEVGGQNVVGLKDDKISEIIDAGGRTITITLMPSFLYEHIVKCMGNSIVKKLMDHSIPDV